VISNTVYIPGSRGRTIRAVGEDVRLAITEDSLAIMIQGAIDTMDSRISEAEDVITGIDDPADASTGGSCHPTRDASFTSDSNDKLSNSGKQPTIGDSVEIHWPLDEKFYPGTFISFFEEEGKHIIDYNDGDTEKLDLKYET